AALRPPAAARRAGDGASFGTPEPDGPATAGGTGGSGAQAPTNRDDGILVEQLCQLLHHRAAELFGIDDGDRAAIVARNIVADADGGEFDWRTRLDPLDHLAQMPLEIIARIDRQGGIVDRRAVGDDHQDAALFRPRDQAVMRPEQRLAVDIFLEDALAQHQAQALARPPPRRVGRLVNDVSQIVEPPGIGGLPGRDPFLAALAALPHARGEAQDLDLDAAALQRTRQD